MFGKGMVMMLGESELKLYVAYAKEKTHYFSKY